MAIRESQEMWKGKTMSIPSKQKGLLFPSQDTSNPKYRLHERSQDFKEGKAMMRKVPTLAMLIREH